MRYLLLFFCLCCIINATSNYIIFDFRTLSTDSVGNSAAAFENVMTRVSEIRISIL